MTWQSEVRAILTAAAIEINESADFVLEFAHPEGRHLYGDFASAGEAEAERSHLLAQATAGTMREETLGEILSAEAFDRLGREEQLPPGLMATWQESNA